MTRHAVLEDDRRGIAVATPKERPLPITRFCPQPGGIPTGDALSLTIEIGGVVSKETTMAVK